jgi:hypothetical protein
VSSKSVPESALSACADASRTAAGAYNRRSSAPLRDVGVRQVALGPRALGIANALPDTSDRPCGFVAWPIPVILATRAHQTAGALRM